MDRTTASLPTGSELTYLREASRVMADYARDALRADADGCAVLLCEAMIVLAALARIAANGDRRPLLHACYWLDDLASGKRVPPKEIKSVGDKDCRNASLRDRYRNDPQYRETVKERNRRYRANKQSQTQGDRDVVSGEQGGLPTPAGASPTGTVPAGRDPTGELRRLPERPDGDVQPAGVVQDAVWDAEGL